MAGTLCSQLCLNRVDLQPWLRLACDHQGRHMAEHETLGSVSVDGDAFACSAGPCSWQSDHLAFGPVRHAGFFADRDYGISAHSIRSSFKGMHSKQTARHSASSACSQSPCVPQSAARWFNFECRLAAATGSELPAPCRLISAYGSEA
jgi:hypothetical protein